MSTSSHECVGLRPWRCSAEALIRVLISALSRIMMIMLRRSMEINKNQQRTCKGPTKDVNCHGHDFVSFITTASATEEYRKALHGDAGKNLFHIPMQ